MELKQRYPPEDILGEDGVVSLLRVTDLKWSKDTLRLDRVVQESSSRVMYYLKDGPECAFVGEEPSLIPQDTELPLEYVTD